jgi:hypothetical protein
MRLLPRLAFMPCGGVADTALAGLLSG